MQKYKVKIKNREEKIMVGIQIKIPIWLDMIFAWPVAAYRQRKYGYGFRKIYLDEEIYTIVEPEDYYYLKQFNWHLYGNNHKYYARCEIRTGRAKTKTTAMHRMLTNAPKGVLVDHKNGDSLDNRRENLRFATHQQNMHNSRKQANCTSKYLGVSWHKSRKKWRATLNCNKKCVLRKYFDSETDAAKAHDEAAKIYHGEFARLNFPD
jgi:hypothetical protein